jgi:hypothetical protein
MKVPNFIKTTRSFLCKHSPAILTGIGVAGMTTSTVLAVRATPKAMMLINQAKEEKGDDLSKIETIKVAWKPYIPAAVTGVMAVSCIIGASAVNYKRNAALATAYAISERTLLTYRDKVIETIGEKKEKEIQGKVSQAEVDKRPVSSSQVIITPKGSTLFLETISGRYFKSDIESIRKVVNELNREMTYGNYISLDEWYYKLGLESTETSSRMGWNLDDGLLEIDFDSCIAKNDEPCIVIKYRIAPKYDFDKLF